MGQEELIAELMPFILGAGVTIQVMMLLSFLLKAWGLWNINKKLGEKYAWLAWIPMVNLYSYYRAGDTSFVKYFVYPFIAYILGLVLAIFTFGITAIAAVIYMIYCVIHMLHNISKRTDRGVWTTIGLIFIAPIMLAIIGHKLKEGGQGQESSAQINQESVKVGKSEEL